MQKIKKAKPFSKYRPIVAYLDDLHEIVEAMTGVGGKVELSTEDYKFASLENAKAHFGHRPQNNFTLSCSDLTLLSSIHAWKQGFMFLLATSRHNSITTSIR